MTDGHNDEIIKPSPVENSTVTIRTALVGGQSNMERMEWYALDAIKEAYEKRHPGTRLEFVTCSEGGTWSGHWVPDGGGGFANCVAKAQGKIIDFILWWQGESDAYNQITYWGQNFAKTVAGFRSSFKNELLPVIFAQIAFTTDPNWNRGWESIKQQQAAICIPGVRMIRTDDLAVLADEVHINAESARRIARRFAKNMR